MRKLMWFTVGFAASCILSGYWLPQAYYLPAMLVCCFLLIISLLCLLRVRQARLPTAILLGAILGFCWLSAFDGLYYAPVRNYDGQSGYISLTALDHSETTNYGCSVECLLELDGKPYRVQLYLYGEETVSLGERVSGLFQLKSTLPDGKADSAYYRSMGILLIAGSGKGVSITEADTLPWYCWPAGLRHEITGLLNSIFHEDTLAFARAILLGDTSLMDYEAKTDLKVSGIYHVVSVSGMHVSILFGLVYFLTGRRKWLVVLLGLPVLFLFAAIVGFDAPITRACFMYTVMVISMVIGSEYDAPTSLSFAVLLMLMINPLTAIHVGFQLSVSCMIGMLAFTEPIRDWLLSRRRLGKYKCRKLMSAVSTSVAVSLGATVVTAPLCAYYFGMVSLVGLVTNVLTLWVLNYVFYGILAACAVALLWQPLGTILAWIVSWGIRYTLWVAGWMADFPFTAVYMQSTYMVSWLVFCYVLLIVFVHMRGKRPLVFSCCAAMGLCLALLLSWTEPLQDECRVTVMDVGQGQCILLQSEGKSILVDCGGDSAHSAADTAAGQLLSQGVSRLDAAIVTHYDADHAGGVEMLLSRVPTDRLYLPNTLDEDGISASLDAYTEGAVISVQHQQVIAYGDTKITLIPSKNGLTDNESGLCILFQTKNCDILITGDRGSQGEMELMDTVTLPKLELLIVGHHGSKYSTCEALLAQTSPQYAIISVGEGNSYGHPTREVLDRLTEIGCIYYRTDQHGTVVYRG